MYKNLWHFLFLSAIFASGMAVCLVINTFWNNLYVQIVGVSFVIAGIVVLVIMVYSLRKMFNNDTGMERTWRSYR